MLIAFWSPKGGSGTSVLAAATAGVLSRRGGAALADLQGDQPAICGLARDPDIGLRDWLAAGPEAPSEALSRLGVDVAPGLELLPTGGRDLGTDGPPLPEAGAALGVALRDRESPTVADVGTLARTDPDVADALLEVADVSVLVVRPCYLTLRRAVAMPTVARVDVVALVDEPGRALAAPQVLDVLGLRTSVKVPVRSSIARAVDAGVVVTRPPDVLRRTVREVLRVLGVDEDRAPAA
ncbi:MAG: hypothetical protein R3A49_13095 [Acidimicrobiia bacterium]